MSYNIDTWKVKELDRLVIPVKALCEGNDYFNAPELNIETGMFTINGMDGTYLNGRIDSDMFHVAEIQCRGEGSGSTYRNVLLPALEQSGGALIVACVWEGGDSLSKLIVTDGKVTEEDIEL